MQRLSLVQDNRKPQPEKIILEKQLAAAAAAK